MWYWQIAFQKRCKELNMWELPFHLSCHFGILVPEKKKKLTKRMLFLGKAMAWLDLFYSLIADDNGEQREGSVMGQNDRAPGGGVTSMATQNSSFCGCSEELGDCYRCWRQSPPNCRARRRLSIKNFNEPSSFRKHVAGSVLDGEVEVCWTGFLSSSSYV